VDEWLAVEHGDMFCVHAQCAHAWCISTYLVLTTMCMYTVVIDAISQLNAVHAHGAQADANTMCLSYKYFIYDAECLVGLLMCYCVTKNKIHI